MSNEAKNEMPRGLKPVQSVELSENRLKTKWILVGAFVVLALVAFGIAINGWLSEEPGWVEIEATAGKMHCGEDFIFSYCLGEGELSPTKEKKQIRELYSQCVVNAYQLFHASESFEGVVNLHTLNQNPNQPHTVSPTLYNALALSEQSGGRLVYLGALAEEYRKAFFVQSEQVTAEEDPAVDAEYAAFCKAIADYANDSQSVQLELDENYTVTLRVSEEYLAYASENGLEVFVDLHRIQNAFIIDYLADQMIGNGFTKGCISSCDGYVRNLDDGSTPYSINLFHLRDLEIYPAARMEYTGARAIVSMRSYPMGERDSLSYCILPNGTIITPYLNPETGLYTSAASELVAYSESNGCAALAMKLWTVYTAQTLDTEALNSADVSWIWIDDTVIRTNDSDLILKELYDDGEVIFIADIPS